MIDNESWKATSRIFRKVAVIFKFLARKDFKINKMSTYREKVEMRIILLEMNTGII